MGTILVHLLNKGTHVSSLRQLSLGQEVLIYRYGFGNLQSGDGPMRIQIAGRHGVVVAINYFDFPPHAFVISINIKNSNLSKINPIGIPSSALLHVFYECQVQLFAA